MKSQGVRLIDVFVLGPFMIWYALTSAACASIPPEAALILLISGILTITYNGTNWVAALRRGAGWV